jgi:hypothetical protein
MHMGRAFALALTITTCAAAPAPAADPPPGIGDATVIAVIDSAMNPYHWDFLAAKMPPGQGLPLSTHPSEWLPGYPADAQRMSLTLDATKATTDPATLVAKDRAKWDAVKPGTVYWFPGTKVIGAMTYSPTAKIVGTTGEHGVGTSSVAVGNIHGTCPECLLFFIQYGDRAGAEAAIEWAEQQPWIDAISNSYGFSLVSRDRLYSQSDTEAQRAATERGQTLFFSSGNGQGNDFVVPNTTTFSSQEGPDWIVTVGAVTQGAHDAITGTGKPADVAGIGNSYPSAYTAEGVGETGASGFGGTSNATPQIAGLYGRTLFNARTALAGPSRGQAGGVIATGTPVPCGAANENCELGDGVLTAAELRARLLRGATHTGGGMDPGAVGVTLPGLGEDEYLAVGHGYYTGREDGDSDLAAEESDTLLAQLAGTAPVPERPEGEQEWMVVDSYCRQLNWGSWAGGYYVEGETDLPGFDQAWPVRSLLEETCPGGPTPVN